MPEIRRLITRFQLSAGLCLDFILSWSLWRRVHQAVAKACHQAGLVTLTCGTFGNVVRFLPPLVIGEDLLDEGLSILDASLAEVA
jgi:acetylornithine/succinyldiaminopimelate/putrescine aminotransferase